MHIVLVEDNATLAKSVVKVLKEEGYGITHFDNGALAHAWLSQNKDVYDLVILDILLPEMNGLTICSELRRDKVTVPILILTSKGELEDMVDGLDCGAG